ncbi:O-antigen ligase family protein [Desulfonatronospira thiodismutans]|uniref:O-antigen ligase family protein n=1 Tax=Desulfonatronospira thiodismutans TaxID=488939 RepID=UPI0013762A76|nr:O-antigen ligase family protein [Desulfonatronospira thiodismutans]
MDSIPYVTYSDIYAGFSVMQIYSIFVVAYLSMYLFFHRDTQVRSIPAAIPVLLVILSFMVSGIISNDWRPILENTTKWIYMILLAGFVFHILKTNTLDSLIRVLWLSLLPAVFIQFMAIITNDYVITSAGHIGYFGGYQHQNMISYYLLGFTSCSLYLAVQSDKLFYRLFFMLSTGYGIFAVYACGYRTTLIALMIFLIITYLYSIKRLDLSKKLLAISFMPLVMIVGIYFAGGEIFHRLSDIWVFLQAPMDHIDFSGNASMTSLFSGRIYIINVLMHAYLSSPFESLWAGMGLDSARQIIGTYPHNEFLAALVESGILGLSAFSLFVVTYLWTVNSGDFVASVKESVIAGTGTGLLIMTLATMPFRDMRAMILFGVFLGIAHFSIYMRRQKPHET